MRSPVSLALFRCSVYLSHLLRSENTSSQSGTRITFESAYVQDVRWGSYGPGGIDPPAESVFDGRSFSEYYSRVQKFTHPLEIIKIKVNALVGRAVKEKIINGRMV